MNILIIGGGASGMIAALTAAERGHTVTVLERQARVGRKLLATGNGRCNLTNRNVSPVHYHGGDFAEYALSAFSVDDTLDFFARLGLVTVTEDSGRVYPFSNMAGSVLDVLRYALEQPNIDAKTSQVVMEVRKSGSGFTVKTETDTFTADRVILAAGGCAGAKVGGVTDGYRIAEALGHHRTALYPSLVQLKTDPAYPRALKGIKAEAAITIARGSRVIARNRGEILFTEYGVSGPAIFDLSRAVAAGGKGLTCLLNFFPDWSETDVLRYVNLRRKAMAAHEAGALLTGAFHTRLGQMVCKAARFTNQSAAALTDDDLSKIVTQATAFSLPVTGVCGFDQAQVTAGGLDTSEFDPATLQSRLMPGFYACGEVLDVDGECGGYNLQWAWSSGRLAGQVK